MDGILTVTPAALRACADRAQTTGQTVSALAARAADACDRAAAPHRTWRFGSALAALAPPWRRQLDAQGAAASGDAANLHGTAATYASAENANVGLARAAGRGA